MTPSITIFAIDALSAVVLVGQIFAVILFILLIANRFNPKNKNISKFVGLISDNYVAIIFVITAGATLASLALSEILNFAPCKLCWYQRAFMYPQVIISGVALFTNDLNIRKYLIPMSVIGLIIAVYHILVQAFPRVIQCGDEIVSCSSNQLVGFGYITIPVMSLTAFTLLILICIANKREKI